MLPLPWVDFNTCTDGVVQLQENTPVGRVTQEGIPSPLKQPTSDKIGKKNCKSRGRHTLGILLDHQNLYTNIMYVQFQLFLPRNKK